MSEVNMPKLSDTMEEGTVLEWKKQDGDQVSKGEVLAEIESDKASFEIEAESDGVLHIVVDKGSPVPVGQQIATIGGEAPQRQEKEARPDERRAEGGAADEQQTAESEESGRRDDQEPSPDQADEPATQPPARSPEVRAVPRGD